ncbi:MFS transporter [Streptomyces phaeochromogenes]|uniref:MFS transporter n=1 Tax=Streptomyces phaeochromogenes TaxID=1923 RepID=UPI002E2A1E4B|nr:MFS transporter [Streptomyces phaeochromogenes]
MASKTQPTGTGAGTGVGAGTGAGSSWIVVVSAGVAAGLQVWKLPPAVPFLRQDLSLTLVQAGTLLGIIQLAGMLGGLAISLLAELIGERRCLSGGLVLLFLGSAGGGFAWSAGSLLASRAVEGAGFILVVVTGPGLIRRSTPPGRLTTAMGFWGAYQGISTFAGLITGAFVLQVVPWRVWWWAMAVLVLVPLPWVLARVPRDELAYVSRDGLAYVPRDVPGRVSFDDLAYVARDVPGRVPHDIPVGVPRDVPVGDPGDVPTARVPRENAGGGRGAASALARIGRTVRAPAPWAAGLVFACYTLPWMAVVGFLPTIYRDGGMAGVWPGVLSAVVGAANAVGSITTAALMKRGLPARALLVPAFVLMATTSLPAFAVDWQTLPAGTTWQFLCVVAFSLTGGAIPATLLRMIGELTPTGGSAPATMGLIQQLFNTGSFVGPALAAWLATRTGGWHSTWWMTCACAAVGVALSLRLRSRATAPVAAPAPAPVGDRTTALTADGTTDSDAPQA